MNKKLYNIEPNEFVVLERTEVKNSITYQLEPLSKPKECPQCHDTNFIKHGITHRKARDLNEFGKMVGIVINGNRYLCKTCGKSWVDTFQTIDADAKMTTRMRDYIREQSFKMPFSHIKRELDVSVPTVEKIFNAYVEKMESKRQLLAPRILGMDETMLNGIYRGMFVDVENRRIIDMTEDRKLVTVRHWLASLPLKERIECCTIDMWGSYKTAIEKELPNAVIIIDKFHVIKHLNEALDTIRKKEASKLTDAQRRHIKGNRWLMLTNSEELDFMQQCRLQDMLYTFPQFAKPHELKESFREIYQAETRAEAEQLFDEWKKECKGYGEFEAFASMVENWRNEIFNYFDYRFTNAITESINRISKEISSQGRGYNFKVLRAKILYRNPASKPAKYRYDARVDEKSDTNRKIIIGAGIDIDEIMKDLNLGRFHAYCTIWDNYVRKKHSG